MFWIWKFISKLITLHHLLFFLFYHCRLPSLVIVNMIRNSPNLRLIRMSKPKITVTLLELFSFIIRKSKYKNINMRSFIFYFFFSSRFNWADHSWISWSYSFTFNFNSTCSFWNSIMFCRNFFSLFIEYFYCILFNCQLQKLTL